MRKPYLGMLMLMLMLTMLMLIGVSIWGAPVFDIFAGLFDRERLGVLVDRAGLFGPLVIVVGMTVAVVASPIPSAPVALVAGAAYGHVAGTIYVILGAEIGAIIAFAIARQLGRDAMRRWFGDRLEKGFLGSQDALTLTVLLSRLMPFVSFDFVSYAAGVSNLHFWRFALATLAGVVPASFVLAHFGSVAAESGGQGIAAVALGLGLITAAPLLFAALRNRRRNSARVRSDDRNQT
ncbi:MAG: VTT domain-containing protein [Erythrobacter sp.]